VPAVPFPLAASDPRDVQGEDGQRAEHDHAGSGVNPLSDVRSDEDGCGSGSEVECDLERNAVQRTSLVANMPGP